MEDAPASSWAEICWSCSGVTRMPVAAILLLLGALVVEQFYVRPVMAANDCPQPLPALVLSLTRKSVGE
jgi:hypothetical protein